MSQGTAIACWPGAADPAGRKRSRHTDPAYSRTRRVTAHVAIRAREALRWLAVVSPPNAHTAASASTADAVEQHMSTSPRGKGLNFAQSPGRPLREAGETVRPWDYRPRLTSSIWGPSRP
jgi:hypothetical protein